VVEDPPIEYVPGRQTEHPSKAVVAPSVIKSALYPGTHVMLVQLVDVPPNEN